MFGPPPFSRTIFLGNDTSVNSIRNFETFLAAAILIPTSRSAARGRHACHLAVCGQARGDRGRPAYAGHHRSCRNPRHAHAGSDRFRCRRSRHPGPEGAYLHGPALQVVRIPRRRTHRLLGTRVRQGESSSSYVEHGTSPEAIPRVLTVGFRNAAQRLRQGRWSGAFLQEPVEGPMRAASRDENSSRDHPWFKRPRGGSVDPPPWFLLSLASDRRRCRRS